MSLTWMTRVSLIHRALLVLRRVWAGLEVVRVTLDGDAGILLCFGQHVVAERAALGRDDHRPFRIRPHIDRRWPAGGVIPKPVDFRLARSAAGVDIPVAHVVAPSVAL